MTTNLKMDNLSGLTETAKFYEDGILKLLVGYQKCVEVDSNYMEKYSMFVDLIINHFYLLGFFF